MYDVIIIGAGVAGAASARELSRYQAKICVLEKEEVLQLALPLCQHIFALVDGKLCRHADRAALLAFAVIFLQHHLFEFHVDKAFFLICLLA